MPHCLIVSPHFPPSTLAGVHRARHLAKHLGAFGWIPTILTVDAQYHAEVLDPELAQLVPSFVRQVRTGAIPIAWTSWFGLRGDIGLRAFFHLRAAVGREISCHHYQVVLITGSPFFPMLLTRWITKHFGIPVVLDFQDPWVSKEGDALKAISKAWFSHKLALSFEPLALSYASWVTSVSDRQNVELLQRYPWLDSERMSAIPIGGDPEDYLRISESSGIDKTAGLVEFCYVGSTWPRGMPLLRLLIQGIYQFEKDYPTLASKVCFRFVGTSNRPGKNSDYRVLPIAKQFGIEKLIIEEPGRVGYLDALKIMMRSHAVLIFGSDEPHYTASKIFPVLMSKRPFLSLLHKDSSAHHILSAAGGGIAIPWSDCIDSENLARKISDAIDQILNRQSSVGIGDPSAYAEFTAESVSRSFARIFDTCSLTGKNS